MSVPPALLLLDFTILFRSLEKFTVPWGWGGRGQLGRTHRKCM